MHFQGNQIHIKKSYLYFFILIILFAFATPVLADYLGPNRSVTTYEVEAVDYGVWAKDNDGSCSTTYEADDCIVCEWEGSPGNPCGDAEYSYKLGTRYEPVAVTTTYPAATVNGTLQNCTLQNGWCVTSPQLQITANEPVSGYHILLIEGIYNSEIFACAENPCVFSFATEGNHALEYWALSSWGDSSHKGTTNVKVDTVAPNLNLLVNGTLGQNNWYVSDTTITAIGQDDTSGINEQVLSIDNGITWIPSTTLTDGVYQVDIKVTDNAYNVSTASTTLQVDTTTPTLSLSISGAKGNNNYYISKPKITATTFDATSGIALVQAKIDSGNWIDANEITIEDGIHTYQFRVYDNAGNMTETPVQNIKVDTTPPSVEADEEINLGDTLFYTLRDNGSGLWIERIVIEDEDEKYKKIVWLQEISGNKIEGDILWDGKFADKTLAGVGEYFITFKISDRAGNETFYTTIVNVNPISYLQSIPEFIPPETSNEPTSELENEETNEQSFGGTTSQTENSSTTQTFELVTGVSNGMASSNSLPAPSLILTGALAVTAIAAAMKVVNDAQKKREEEEAQSYQQAKNQAAKLNEAEEERKANLWWQGQINNFYESLPSLGLSEKQLLEVLDTLSTQGLSAAQTLADNLNSKNTAKTVAGNGGTTNTPATTNNPFAGSSVESGGLGTSQQSGGTKVFAMPAPQDPNPPDEHNDGVSSWWDLLDLDWWKSDEPWPWESPQPVTAPTPLPTAQVFITPGALFTPTPLPTAQVVIVTQTPNIPLSTPIPLSSQVAILANQRYSSDNPEYYKYGLEDWNKYYTNCSNFVSQVLWDAGIRFPSTNWNGDNYKLNPTGNGNEAWLRTPIQQQLFSANNGEFRIMLNGNVPLKEDVVYTQILKDYPQLFKPGSVVFTSNRVIQIINGTVMSDINGQFSHAMIIDINATNGNPIVVEQDGPSDYILENGAYKAVWDPNVKDYFYIRNPEPIHLPRLLSDIPTGQIFVDGYPGEMTVNVTTSQISIVPVEKIDLSTYNVNHNVLNNNPIMVDDPDQIAKPCYPIQPALYYCPPTVPTP